MMTENRRGEISASLMCANYFEIGNLIAGLNRNGVEYLHMDVMDGRFVPNFAIGTDLIRQVQGHSKIPMDFHLMVTNPRQVLDYLPIREGDLVAIHLESPEQVAEAITEAHARGFRVLAALKPDTPLSALEPYYKQLWGVLVMTVHPGFAAQQIIAQTIEKTAHLKALLLATGREQLRIQVDGNISYQNSERLYQQGADLYVAGSSSIFGPGNLDENIARFRSRVGWTAPPTGHPV